MRTRRVCSALTALARRDRSDARGRLPCRGQAAQPLETARQPAQARGQDVEQLAPVPAHHLVLAELHLLDDRVRPEAGESTPPTQTLEALVPYSGFSAGEIPIRQQASALYATAIALDTGYYVAESNRRLGRRGAPTHRRVDHGTRRVLPQGPLGRKVADAALGQLPGLRRQACLAVSARAHPRAGHGGGGKRGEPPARPRSRATTAMRAAAIISPGDSQSEENAWRASLLIFAAREFPGNPNAGLWEEKGRVFLVNAYASPDQVGTDSAHHRQQHRPQRHGHQPQPHPPRLHARPGRDDLEARAGVDRTPGPSCRPRRATTWAASGRRSRG